MEQEASFRATFRKKKNNDDITFVRVIFAFTCYTRRRTLITVIKRQRFLNYWASRVRDASVFFRYVHEGEDEHVSALVFTRLRRFRFRTYYRAKENYDDPAYTSL